MSASPEDLAAELADALRPGITPRSLLDCRQVLALSVVGAHAASDTSADRAAAAYGLLRQVVIEVDGQRDGPTAQLVGLASGSRGALLKERRRRAAELLHISPAHLRTSQREQRLIQALADELHAFDSAYRMRQRHREEPERAAPLTRLGVDWLARHQAYRRLWTPISALRDDLWVLLELMREDAGPHALTDRVLTMTWRYAQFQVEQERFIDELGGLWLLSDIGAELAAADALRRLDFYVPFGESDDSWLRVMLSETPSQELEPFSDRIVATERGEAVLATWLSWARTCSCRPIAIADGCLVHRWCDAADEFVSLIDEDWYRVADWYRQGPDPAALATALEELWRTRSPRTGA